MAPRRALGGVLPQGAGSMAKAAAGGTAFSEACWQRSQASLADVAAGGSPAAIPATAGFRRRLGRRRHAISAHERRRGCPQRLGECIRVDCERGPLGEQLGFFFVLAIAVAVGEQSSAFALPRRPLHRRRSRRSSACAVGQQLGFFFVAVFCSRRRSRRSAARAVGQQRAVLVFFAIAVASPSQSTTSSLSSFSSLSQSSSTPATPGPSTDPALRPGPASSTISSAP